jgi:hypothetical protein
MDDNILQPQQLGDVLADIKERVVHDKNEESMVAQVVVTPAWQEVITKLEAQSSAESILAELRPLLKDASVSNEKLGQFVRVAVDSADKVRSTINQVTETVKAHEQ